MDYAATLFAHNHLYNGMLQTRDAGLITGYYCSGGTLNNQNTQIIYNVLHDTFDPFAIQINKLGLIYLDEATCDVDLFNNLLWAAPGSLQRGFWFNTSCVDIRERDNVFHGRFIRTCAELEAEDFPSGNPFRFGHDFQNPPPLPGWQQVERRRIEAESCNSIPAGVKKAGGVLNNLQDGDSFALDNVDLGQGWQSAVIRFASDDEQMNSDLEGRTPPRHIRATDPLALEATVNDSADSRIKKQWTFVYNMLDGTWLRFNHVPLGKGYKRFRVIYGNDVPSPRHLEVRLDSMNGAVAGRVDLRQTDKPRGAPHVQVYEKAVCEISPEATGTRDVFLVFHSADDSSVGAFEYFRFEQYRGQIPLQKNEVKLEIRAGSRDGEKLGEFYPRFTGGADVFREMVATLEPTNGTGLQSLYFVVRSATGRPVGAIDWISLEKGQQPLDMTGLGIEPLKRDGGYVYPEPTHLPLPPDIRRLPSRLREKIEKEKKSGL